jgi:hypothetical protein
MRSLDSATAFREAIYWGATVGVVAALVGSTCYHMSHWYNPPLARVLFIALGVGGFGATFSLLIAYYHRFVLLGLVALGAFALPIVAVLASLCLARIPLEGTLLWAVIPAGIAGELVFEIVRRFHSRHVAINHTLRS